MSVDSIANTRIQDGVAIYWYRPNSPFSICFSMFLQGFRSYSDKMYVDSKCVPVPRCTWFQLHAAYVHARHVYTNHNYDNSIACRASAGTKPIMAKKNVSRKKCCLLKCHYRLQCLFILCQQFLPCNTQKHQNSNLRNFVKPPLQPIYENIRYFFYITKLTQFFDII